MSYSPASGQIVLKEVFDEKSVPTEEEINDYALQIGIDVENESHLLYLAQDGLMQALPSGWKPCYDKDKKEVYYFNFKTKKAQWEHPLDDIYRNLVKKARNESALSEVIDEDSRTSIREDLKSYEEASMISTVNEMYNKTKRLEPLSPLGKKILKKVPAVLSPIKKSKDSLKPNILKPTLQIDQESLIQKSSNVNLLKKEVFDDTEVRKRPNSSDIRNRRNIGPLEFRHLIKQEIINPQSLEKFNFLTDAKKVVDNKTSLESPNEAKAENNIITRDEGYGTEFSVSSTGEKDGNKKELTLAGGGSIFLKTNKTKFSPSSDIVTSSFSKEELSDGLLSPDLRKFKNQPDNHLKSILRDQSNQNNQNAGQKAGFENDEKNLLKDDIDDDKKSVRFNLEKELKVCFEIPSSNKKKSDEVFAEKITSDEMAPGKKTINQESKQIEIDFDDLNFGSNYDKLEKAGDLEKKETEKMPIDNKKTAEPKKFRPSQMLVNEFREIFNKQPKNNINLIEIVKPDNSKNLPIPKSSRSNNSIILSEISESNENSQSSQDVKSNTKESQDKKLNNENKIVDAAMVECLENNNKKNKTNEKNSDSSFDELVNFAIKKKFNIEKECDESMSKILYPERDLFLGEILQENDILSVDDESESDKIFASQQKELEYLETLESQINLKAQKRKGLEEDLKKAEKMKNETLNELEKEFGVWLNETKESYIKKKKEKSEGLEKEYETWCNEKEEEFEKLRRKKYEEEFENRIKQLKCELVEKEKSDIEKLKLQLDAEQKERLNKLKLELEAEEIKELDALRKNFENDLNEKKADLIKKHKEEILEMEKSLENFLSQEKLQKLEELKMTRENETAIEAMRLEVKESYQKQRNALMNEHECLLENLKKDHALIVEQMKQEFKNKEENLKKVLLSKLENIKTNVPQENDEEKKSLDNIKTPKTNDYEVKVFEKVHCEKNLLENKYKMLKEKYIKLKSEAKSTLERKKNKKDLSAATGSETETCYSNLPSAEMSDCESPVKRKIPECTKPKSDKEKKLRKQTNRLECSSQDLSTEDEENICYLKNSHLNKKQQEINDDLLLPQNIDQPKEILSKEEKKIDGHQGKKKKQLFSRFKSVGSSQINSTNKSQKKVEKEVLSPVENLRRQLKKLEELEDQFPIAAYTDTYMRYPFTDNAQFGSSEIEFFKHRIHLERESVRRAKDSLKAQKKTFENRQRQLRQKLIEGEPGAKNIVDQIYQESKELTDMEVAVYRTRALLGEKIIRLRHLEQSLRRISQPIKKSKDFLERLGVRNQNKDDERTLSDLSSNSGSSGFSSNDFNDATNALVKKTNMEQNGRNFQTNMQESSEIIQSLENLNSEIREIWEVLKNQHQPEQETITMLPSSPLIFGDIGWSGFTLSPPLPFRNTIITSSSNVQRPVAQQFKTQVTSTSNLRNTSTILDSALIDKTRSLRDWLRAAKNQPPSEIIRSSQVTL